MTAFGERLKSIRKENKLTQIELASYLNIKQSHISSYETNANYPEIPLLLKIADFFNVSLDYLLGRSDFKNINNKQNDRETTLIDKFRKLDDKDKMEIENIIDMKNSFTTQTAISSTSTNGKKENKSEPETA